MALSRNKEQQLLRKRTLSERDLPACNEPAMTLGGAVGTSTVTRFPHRCCVKKHTQKQQQRKNGHCQHGGVGARCSGQIVGAQKHLPVYNRRLRAREDRYTGPDSRVLFLRRYSAQTEEGECCSAADRGVGVDVWRWCHEGPERLLVPAAHLLSLDVYHCVTWSNAAVSVVMWRQTPFGLFRIALVVVPFLYVGTQISKNFAALLEEHDIFVPEDDDDDD